jgi:hypothetical protein
MSSYNLSTKGENVRIGNWFEEIRLKEDTGIRFYPGPKDKKGSLLTQSRCITHTEHTKPKDYSSNTRDTIIDPRSHSDYRASQSSLGPRARRLENDIRREIDEEHKAKEKDDFTETRRINYSTASKESFGISSFVPSLKENDPNLRIPTKTSNYSTDPAVTYYSHSVNTSGSHINFPATFVGSTNPFKKSAAFSADIRRENVAKRTETNERPKPLPTLLEFRTMNDFRGRLVKAAQRIVGGVHEGHTDGRSIRYVIDFLWSSQTDSEVVDLRTLQNCLASTFVDFAMSYSEENAIVCAFDTRSNGNLSLPELTNLVRRTPSPRRLELIDMFYCSLDAANSGVVSVSSVPSSFLVAAKRSQQSSASVFVNTLSLATGSNNGTNSTFTVEEFFDYYIDLSAEVVENDGLFESILVDTWGSL